MENSNLITPEIVAACRRAGACRAGLEYLRKNPRTVAERLHAHKPDWAQWLATCVPGLPEVMRDELHRLTGSRSWWREGQRHREDGPAVEWASGFREWYRDGKLHRADGPAIERPDGGREWWREGQRHREDGPAVEWASGFRAWWREGKLHRDDGPASEWASGYREWWREGVRQPGPGAG